MEKNVNIKREKWKSFVKKQVNIIIWGLFKIRSVIKKKNKALRDMKNIVPVKFNKGEKIPF